MLALATALLLGGVLILRRMGRPAVRLETIFLVYIALYLPVRGLVVGPAAGDYLLWGLPEPVARAAFRPDVVRATDILVLVMCLWIVLITASFSWRKPLVAVQQPDRLSTKHLSPVGYLGLMINVWDAASQNFGVPPPPSIILQVGTALTAIFMAVLSLREARAESSSMWWMLSVPPALLVGSKDLLLGLALSWLIGRSLRAKYGRQNQGSQMPLRLTLVVSVIAVIAIFIVLPVVQAARVGGEFGSIRDVTQGAISGPLGSAVFISNRLHGYDSVILSMELAGTDARFSPVENIARVIPGALVGLSDDRYEVPLGRLFAESVWRSDPRYGTHIAPSFIGQSLLSSGWTLALAIVVLVAMLVALCSRLFGAVRSSRGLLFALILSRFPFYIERDFQATLVGTLRAFLVAAIILAACRYATRSTSSRQRRP